MCSARRNGTAIAEWPGEIPATLDDAYAMQLSTIAAWNDSIIGLKVGRITGSLADETGVDRFLGPIFAATLQFSVHGPDAAFPLVVGGSSALECELVAVLGERLPPAGEPLSPAVLEAAVGDWHVGIEVAGCPVSGVERFGALGSIACFGNNTGLVLGAKIADWRSRDLDMIGCTARIDGEVVGQGNAGRLPGGVWTALHFALSEARARGLPLTPGMLISTGAVTGMHPMAEGCRAEADFGEFGTLACVGTAISAS